MSALQITHRYEQRDGKGDTIAHVELKDVNNVLWLTNLWVDPAYRRQGRGHQLLSVALAQWLKREIYLNVEPYTDQPLSAAALTAWYARYGFAETSVPGVLRLSPEHWKRR